MYKIKDSGKGKLYCYTKGAFALNDNLKQSVLKQLFNDNCEHIYYDTTTTESEASTQEPVHSETKDTSNGDDRSGRKANTRKANKGKSTN